MPLVAPAQPRAMPARPLQAPDLAAEAAALADLPPDWRESTAPLHWMPLRHP